ncbi:MAG: excisionase family DNA-binding protein [Planctomycetes bacterium]|nr:excisionase family DNA-binding protein [Planctomycetota bacterium]
MRQTNSATKLLERQAAAVVDRLLTVREVAARLGISGRQVQKLLASGRFPAPVRLGRSVRWRNGDVSRFIECGCNMAAFNARSAGGAA